VLFSLPARDIFISSLLPFQKAKPNVFFFCARRSETSSVECDVGWVRRPPSESVRVSLDRTLLSVTVAKLEPLASSLEVRLNHEETLFFEGTASLPFPSDDWLF
jgi:hypothetical protein